MQASLKNAVQGRKVPWLPILMYHRVVDRVDAPDPYRLCVTASEFETHMKYLCDRRFQVISVEDVARATAEGEWPWVKPVVITFDDGYMDNYTYAFPILKKYELKASIMLVTSYIGRTNEWDQDSDTMASPLLGTDEIQEMARNGITYGSHTLTHRALTELDDDEAWKELVESKSALEALTGSEINVFCYPYGHSTPRLHDMVMRAGYSAAIGIEQVEHTLFNLSRVNSARTKNSALLWRLKVSGVYHRLLGNRVSRRLIDIVRGGSY